VLAESELREREARLRLIIEGAQDYAIITTDPDRRVTTWSPGAEAAFGWTAAEMINCLADEIFTPEDRASGQPEWEARTAIAEGSAADKGLGHFGRYRAEQCRRAGRQLAKDRRIP
jgi:PAS domain-containing protein